MTHCMISLIESFPLSEDLAPGDQILFTNDHFPPQLNSFSTAALISMFGSDKPDLLNILPLTSELNHSERWIKSTLSDHSYPLELTIWNASLAQEAITEVRMNHLSPYLAELIQGLSRLSIDVSHLSRASALATGVALARLISISADLHIEVWDSYLDTRGFETDQWQAHLALVWDSRLLKEKIGISLPLQKHIDEPKIDEIVENTVAIQSYLDDPEFKQRLNQLGDLSLSLYKPDKREKADQIQAHLIDLFPQSQTMVEDLRKRMNKVQPLMTKAYQLGLKRGKGINDQLLNELKELNLKQYSAIVGRLKENNQSGLSRRSRKNEEKSALRKGQALSKVKVKNTRAIVLQNLGQGLPHITRSRYPVNTDRLHPNDIRGLTPQSQWTLLLDESGADFVDGKGHVPPCFTSILIPEKSGILPKIALGWHAKDMQSSKAIDDVIQDILDAQVGVMGIRLEALPRTIKERWLDGMITVVDLVLRLLPLDGPTQLVVKIENRAEFKAGRDLKDLTRFMLNRLGRAWPQRARLINLRLQIIKKTDDARNGYADALAFIWGSPSPSAKACLAQSKLLGSCFIEDDSKSLRSVWDHFDRRAGINPAAWVNLASRKDAIPQASGLVSTLLREYAHQLQRDPKQWGELVAESLKIEFEKSLSLRHFSQLIEWLHLSKSEESKIPLNLELIWLTIQLARSNHKGDLESGHEKRRQELCETLYDEDARLVCITDLHEAVSLTNRFEYEAARQSLHRWLNIPAPLIGLRIWGRVQSSLGQHAAFLGEFDKAKQHFDKALNAFDKLSSDNSLDIKQSQSYLLTVLIDDLTVSDESVKKRLLKFIEKDSTQGAIRAIAKSGIFRQYEQHLFLRWLVFRGDEVSRKEYLSHQSLWKTFNGHPWELIEAYRALLIAREAGQMTQEARDLLMNACDQSFATGYTVQYIGLVLRTLAVGWGEPWLEAAQFCIQTSEQLPKLKEQIEIIAQINKSPKDLPSLDPKSLALWFNRFLKFNFR